MDRRLKWLLAVALTTTACGSVAQPTTTTLAGTSTAEATTTIPTPMSPAEALEATLGNPEFSARVTSEGTVEAPGLVVTTQGEGVISGSDSMIHLERDFSQFEYTVMDIDGNILGPGGLSTLSEESRLVGGDLYEKVGDDRWMRLPSGSDTSLGHVFDRLAQVEGFEDLGVVDIDGMQLLHFQPATLVEYDPRYFGLDPETLNTFVSITDLYTDEVGAPRIIDIQTGLEHVSAGAQIWKDRYRLEDLGTSVSVERPPAWVRATDLGLDFGNIDLLVPEDWELTEIQSTTATFLTPDGFTFWIGVGLAEGVDRDQLLDEFVVIQEAEVLTREEFGSVQFPGVIAQVQGSGGEPGVFFSSVVADVFVVAGWFPPGQDPEQGTFEEVLTTLIQRNPPDQMVVPGETIGDQTLQTDVGNWLLTTLALEDPPCTDATVVYTKFVSTESDGWSEDWYLLACGTLMVTRVDYTPVDDGVIFGAKLPFDTVGVAPGG